MTAMLLFALTVFTFRWSAAVMSDQLNETAGGGRDVHLTTELANCHSVTVFKGNWAPLQSGATDGEPGGSAFESQRHL